MLEILLLSSHAFTAALLGMADFMGWMQAQTHTVGAVLRKYKKNFSVKVDMASIHPSIFQTAYPIQARRRDGAYPGCRRT